MQNFSDTFHQQAQRLIPDSLISLLARIGLFAPFFFSGLTKSTQGATFPLNLLPNENTFYQFVELFGLPFPTFNAYAATFAELIFPVLILLGIFTRGSALALIAMVLVIHFVDTNLAIEGDWYSLAEWKNVLKGIIGKHALWLVSLLFLVKNGAGVISLDHLFFRKKNY
jgi:putative oxidoreductase